jgi:hypothetical protein
VRVKEESGLLLSVWAHRVPDERRAGQQDGHLWEDAELDDFFRDQPLTRVLSRPWGCEGRQGEGTALYAPRRVMIDVS